MTYEEVEAFFGENDAEYRKFEKVERKLNQNNFIHVLLRLQELGYDDPISGVGHDEIYLITLYGDTSNITEEVCLELIRCGVICCDCGLRMYA